MTDRSQAGPKVGGTSFAAQNLMMDLSSAVELPDRARRERAIREFLDDYSVIERAHSLSMAQAVVKVLAADQAASAEEADHA